MATYPEIKRDMLPIGSLEAYICRVNAHSILSKEEELALAARLQDDGDLAAAQELILSQLRYVVRIAKSYMGYGLPLGDLIQEGTVGLMKAVKRFKPEFNVRLVSFAVHWIKAEMHQYILKNWRIVKVATKKEQIKLFFKLRQQKKRLGWFTPEEVQQVANDLNVSVKEVVEMEKRLNAHDAYFSRLEHDDEKSSNYLPSPEQYLEAPNSNPETQLVKSDYQNKSETALHNALNGLDPRSQDILRSRFLAGKKATLHELADKYQVSAERIRQLEKQAMQKVKESMQ